MSGSEDDVDWVLDVNGWDLQVSLAQELEKEIESLTANLYDYLYDVNEGDGSTWEPPSGYPFCGCVTCTTRESLTVLVPIIAQAVKDMRIKRTSEPVATNVIPLLPHREKDQ